MSLSLLEAMASARSVVVTDVSGMREVAEGVGAVVAPGDPEALATAMVERLRHPERADEEGRRGRERVELSHDRRVQFEGIAALYDDVIGRRAART
jgi:glycosyltransferase involved in cell wall biosynthesis